MAPSKSTVKVVEVCKVAPAPPATSGAINPPKSLPLTFFDLPWLRFPPIQYLSFYKFQPTENKIGCPNSDTKSFFNSDILPKLKNSLALTLRHFLPLAGTLTWPESSRKPIVDYIEGDAVSVTVAEYDAQHDLDFYRLSGTNEFVETTSFHPLLPTLAVSTDRAALLALQVTLFPSCGFSIGLTMHHALLDGKTIYLFVRSWSLMCQSLVSSSQEKFFLPPEIMPFFDRSVIKDRSGRLEAIYAKQLLELDRGPNNRSLMFWELREVPSDSVRGTFQLTRANIERLRKQLIAKSTTQQIRISTFSIACAYVWVCLVKSGEINDKVVSLNFHVDCRSSRLEARIPSTYFGNCFTTKAVVTETKELLEKDGLAVAVNCLAEAIKSLENDKNGVLNGAECFLFQILTVSFWRNTSATAGIRLYNIAWWVVKIIMSFLLSGVTFSELYTVGCKILRLVMFFWCTRRVEDRLYSVAGSPRFEVYTISDFGWGRPRKVDMVSIDRSGGMSLSDTRNGDGEVEVGLVLEKHRMEAFATLFAQGLES
ncbi:phenolic glucoside malonyltransferase 2-like [Humulus lupulus]|uniref:phenolic glucoside malonyltransferase 2-like n=1 Tax=Humulus lupulus TaxID=3486 RepID=UPI002B412D39|nr:phenolic glucoside malonyltransferase 2-like [Humulus lupulus]